MTEKDKNTLQGDLADAMYREYYKRAPISETKAGLTIAFRPGTHLALLDPHHGDRIIYCFETDTFTRSCSQFSRREFRTLLANEVVTPEDLSSNTAQGAFIDSIEVVREIMLKEGVVKANILEEEIKVTPEKPGAKDSSGKLDYTTVPISAITGIAKVREYGIKKYKERDNWITVGVEPYKQALLRHLYKWLDGEACDPESGLAHIDHMLCNLAFIKELGKG